MSEAATNGRQQVQVVIISKMERECSELIKRIISFQNDDTYFEKDLNELQLKTEHLNKKLDELSNSHGTQLNLPVLNCSNMVHIKSFEADSSSKITETVESNRKRLKKEYHSFIERFLTTHQPTNNITVEKRGYVCALSSMLIHVDQQKVFSFIFRAGSFFF